MPLLSVFGHLSIIRMSSNFSASKTIPQSLLDAFASTAGKTITCKAAVAWEAKKPLDVTDIQVRR